MRSFLKEFKEFISRGSVIDLAIAVIIGAAFKDIINSLVKDILTPVISLVVGDEGFSNYKYVITAADEANGIAENAILWGNFIQSTFDFVIIAFVIFMIVRVINKLANAAKNVAEKGGDEILETVEDVMENVSDKVEDVVGDVGPKMEDILLDIKSYLKGVFDRDND